MDGDEEIKMGNEVLSKVTGKGNVDMIFTFGKIVTLTNVLQVPDMNGNLLGKLSNKNILSLVNLYYPLMKNSLEKVTLVNGCSNCVLLTS